MTYGGRDISVSFGDTLALDSVDFAAHAGEGDLVRRSTEATIVHHADFMSFEPFKNLAR